MKISPTLVTQFFFVDFQGTHGKAESIYIYLWVGYNLCQKMVLLEDQARPMSISIIIANVLVTMEHSPITPILMVQIGARGDRILVCPIGPTRPGSTPKSNAPLSW